MHALLILWSALWIEIAVAGDQSTPGPSSASQKSPDQQTGWNGVMWGSAPLRSMDCQSTGASMLCSRPDDSDKRAGELYFKSVLYSYLDDRLYRVLLSSWDMSVCRSVSKSLEAIYGAGVAGSMYGSITWKGTMVEIYFSRDDRSCAVLYSYEPILRYLPEAERAAAAKSGTGL